MTADELLAVVEGQEPPFAAWKVFLTTPDGVSATADELQSLRLICWPCGRQPTVASYRFALSSIRATRPT